MAPSWSSSQEQDNCAFPVKGDQFWLTFFTLVNRWRWRLSSIIIMGPKCFVSGTGTPETGRAKQKEEQSEHHPTHHDHGERQVIPSSSLSAGTRQFLGAVSVCAVGLRLPEQVEKASHCIFMGTDTLTRVKASLCHFEPPCQT